MKTPPDGWDQDEREVLAWEGLRDQLEAVRTRHALAPDGAARLLARIQEEAGRPKVQAARSWPWGFALAAAVLVVGTVWTLQRGAGSPGGTKTPESTVAVNAPPVFHLPLEKPAIKVSPAALAWRASSGENPLLADLKGAFDAFRSGDFSLADREFSALSSKYPASIEIWFHQGVARLFANDIPGAIVSLTTAERLADSSFAWDVAWYRAVAEERAGNLAAARSRLAGLCAQPDARANTACDALKLLPPR